MFAGVREANEEALRDAVVLHVASHALYARDIAMRGDAEVKAARAVARAGLGGGGGGGGPAEEAPRDQGYTRPRVLVLLPHRNAAKSFVRTLLALCPWAKEVGNAKRFFAEYSEMDAPAPTEEDAPNGGTAPLDHRVMMRGNIDDDFRLGISLSRRGVNLYAKFYAADIVLASPLGVRRVAGGPGDRERDYDWMSSVELCVVEGADMLQQQNWEHVTNAFGLINATPLADHGVDFSRVREWVLAGRGRAFRQTLILSRMFTPELSALARVHCGNAAGALRLVPVPRGVLPRVLPQVRQVVQRVEAASHAAAADARFEYFTKTVLPQVAGARGARSAEALGGHVLIYIPTYFDYVRVRNHLLRTDVDFVACSECAAARAQAHV